MSQNKQKTEIKELYQKKGGFFVFNKLSERIIKTNKVFCNMTGYTQKELLKTDFFKLIPVTEIDRYKNYFNHILEKDYLKLKLPVHCKMKFIIKNREIKEINVSLFCVKDNELSFIINNIEEVEEKLELEKIKLNKLINSFPDLIWLKDVNLNIVEVNNAYARVHGFEHSEDMLKNINNFKHPSKVAKVYLQEDKEVLKTSEIIKKEEIIISRKKGKQFFETIKGPILDANKKQIGIFGISRNITEMKRIEKAMKQSKEQYLFLFNNSPLGVILINKTGDITEVNPALLNVLGSPSKEETQKINFFKFPPLREAGIKSDFVKCLKTGKSFVSDRLYKTKWGKEVYLRQHLKPIWGKDDKIEAVQAIVEDVTKSKQAEEALQKSQEKYKYLVNNANDGVIIIGSQNLITFTNKAFLKIVGYNKKELNNFNFLKIIHPDDKNFINNIFKNKFLNKRVSLNFNFKIINKNKQIKHISCNGTHIKEGGKIKQIQLILRDVSENEKLQLKIKEDKKHYEQIINAMQDGLFVIDRRFKIISFNKSFAKKINLRESLIKNKSCHQILGKYQSGLFKGFCEKKNNCLVKKVFKENKSFFYIVKSESSSKNIYYHKIKAFPMKNKKGDVTQVVITIRDISKKKKDEEKVRKLSEFNQGILDNVPVSIMGLDKKGKVKLINRFARNMYGGKILNDNVLLRENVLTKKYKDLLNNGRAFKFDNYKMINFKKGDRYLNIIATPVRDKNKQVESAILMAIDNTEVYLYKTKIEKLNKELEEKVVKRTKQIQKTNQKLNKVLELKSKFMADASHELRTPLTIIQGNLDLIIAEVRSNELDIAENINFIKHEVIRMSNILSDLTVLTDSENRVQKLLYEEVDLNVLLTMVVKSLGILASQKKIDIKFDKIKDIKIFGDELKLEKLFFNVINNAIKYTDKGGKIEVSLKKMNKNIRVEISDNGIGIPKRDLPYIFERFYRVDKSRSRKEGGTGLGLAICKWVAELHGGSIEVDSKVNEGTKFIINLLSNQDKKV